MVASIDEKYAPPWSGINKALLKIEVKKFFGEN